MVCNYLLIYYECEFRFTIECHYNLYYLIIISSFVWNAAIVSIISWFIYLYWSFYVLRKWYYTPFIIFNVSKSELCFCTCWGIRQFNKLNLFIVSSVLTPSIDYSACIRIVWWHDKSWRDSLHLVVFPTNNITPYFYFKRLRVVFTVINRIFWIIWYVLKSHWHWMTIWEYIALNCTEFIVHFFIHFI